MPLNGSGGVTQPGGGFYPAVASSLIESAKVNISWADVYTILGSCVFKNGEQVTTARVPFAEGISNGSKTLTALLAGTATTHAATVGQLQSSAALLIGTVAGTNTITGALTPALAAYAAGQTFAFIPANTNTGATTINIDSVGAKNVFWNGAACVGGELRQSVPAAVIYDGTQFHVIANGFNAPFLDTHAVVQGSADSTKKVRLEVDGLTTATTRVITIADEDSTIGSASDTVKGQIEIAIQSEMETGTSTTLAVVPGRQHFHPGHPKAWLKCDATGNVNASYNIASITDTGTGDLAVAIATDFSSAHYVVATGVEGGALHVGVTSTSQAAGTFSIEVRNTAGTLTDPSSYYFIACGDQA
jgi:hypothetical protein